MRLPETHEARARRQVGRPSNNSPRDADSGTDRWPVSLVPLTLISVGLRDSRARCSTDREMPNWAAACRTLRWAVRSRASAGMCCGFCPRRCPLALACANPARTRSPIRARSNSAIVARSRICKRRRLPQYFPSAGSPSPMSVPTCRWDSSFIETGRPAGAVPFEASTCDHF